MEDGIELPTEDRPLKTTGQTVWIDGDALVIKYSVLYYGFLGQKRVPIDNIKTVSWREPGSFLGGFLEVSILGEAPPSSHASPNVQHQNRFIYDRRQIELWRALKGHLERSSAAHVPVVAASAADEIRKLGDLLRDGLLTEEEFEAQKAKLLR